MDEDIQRVTSAMDLFVNDFFQWCVNNSDKEINLDDVKKLLKDSDTELERISNVSNLANYMARFSSFDQITKIERIYNLGTSNYLGLINNEIPTEDIHLSDEELKFIREIFDYFYDSMFESTTLQKGYLAIKGQEEKTIRDNYKKFFLMINNVCPYCDIRRFDHHSAITVDHFLPRNVYPYLSVYSLNLIPSCGPCNSAFKNSKIKLPIIHPFYHQVADMIKFSFEYSDEHLCKSINYAILPEYEAERTRISNYFEVISINEVYSNILKEVNSDIRKIKRNTPKRYTGDISKALESYIFELIEDVDDNISFHPFRKLKLDLYHQLKSESNFIEYLESVVS
jgi:hypothetical protein